jgi:hypothetical protein
LNDYEKAFVLKMRPLKRAGIDFGAVTREALVGKFGGATEVLLRDLSPVALQEPEYFVQEVSRIFGKGGAMGVCEPIIKYVDMGLYHMEQDTPELALLRQLGPAQSIVSDQNSTLLHQHRIKDEDGNYPDNAS